MTSFNIIATTSQSTVAAEYEPVKEKSDGYQSEAALEERFIRDLREQGYEYLTVRSEAELVANLRAQLEKLNDYRFSDGEWERFFKEKLANEQLGILQKTQLIQQDHVQPLKRDDGTTKNIYLLDKKNVHRNFLQVLNQYTEEGGAHTSRYDVTVLVNGFPLVHIELKRRGVPIREAFNQIDRYQRESFWAGCGLYEYVQIFVISNGTHTKYYSNTTRDRHLQENAKGARQKKKTSNSFEFTSYWSDFKNNILADLRDFTRTFFARHTLLNILTKYCVLTESGALLVMRPYQIAATEQILNRIEIATNYKKYGTIEAGGYVWHTTGSGKTLTSFKTAQLASRLPHIDKVLFVVDRKDLDHQTMVEYDKFEKGAANGNTSTRILQKQLEDNTSSIIITTIQKLGNFVKKNPKHEAFQKKIVLIFDECHRSQFGEMHSQIVRNFKAYYLFGFTGTPIFAANAQSGGNPLLKTTEQAFGAQLHIYTIINAINDGNVLPFRVDYIETVKEKEGVEDTQVRAIDHEKVLLAPERIRRIVSYILEHYDQKTKRSYGYLLDNRRVMGFNSILAVASIPAAMAYYKEIKRQLAESDRKLNVATIFSFAANEEDPTKAAQDSAAAQSGILEDEDLSTEALDATSRDFLESAIGDYNKTFVTNFDTSSEQFEKYYVDLSRRMKNREVDLLIVVNMFLTGFDATTLNTLWVDKNLRMHGLIQAYSRTNRILNSIKTYGNIVAFRKLDDATDEALALFGNKDAKGIVLLKTFRDYYNGYEENGRRRRGYEEVVYELIERFPLGVPVVGEKAQEDFIRLFGTFLRLRNILTSFDDFEGREILSDRDRQDYQSRYVDFYEEYRSRKTPPTEKVDITDDVVFELELVRQDQINIDYILNLVEKYRDTLCKDKEILGAIDRALGSSPELRSKKDLIRNFIASITPETSVKEGWSVFVQKEMKEELGRIITEERLKPKETEKFMEVAFRDGVLKTTGTDLDALLPPVSIFAKGAGANRAAKREGVIERFSAYFQKFFGLI